MKKIFTIVVCALILTLTLSAIQVTPVKAQPPNFSITQIYWGSSGNTVQAKPGDENTHLSVVIRNTDTIDMTRVTTKLYLTGSPFTTPTGESTAFAGATSISAGQSQTFTFTLNIDPNAELKTYTLTMDVTSTTTNYASGVTSTVTIPVQLRGEVRFSTYVAPQSILPGSNDITVNIANDGQASASNVKVTITAPSPLVIVAKGSPWFFDEAKPSDTLSVNMNLYAPLASAGNAYALSIGLSYVDGYGFNDTEALSSGIIVDNPTMELSITPRSSGSILNIESYIVNPDIVRKGETFTLTLNVKNFGDFEAQKATVQLISPTLFATISPSLVSIGNLLPNEAKQVKYDLAVSPTAQAGVIQNFEVDITFTDSLGVTSISKSYIGIPLHGAVDLIVYDVSTIPSPAEIGRQFSFSVTVLNRGTVSAMYTNVSIVSGFPFTQALGGFPYIGELDINAPAPLSLSATVSSEASEGTYPLKLVIYYQDEYNQPHTVMKEIQIPVAYPVATEETVTPTPDYTLYILIGAILAIVAVIGLVAFMMRRRKSAGK